ncbi:hypothetical protein [Aggregatibacter actinomycetemcomitans]|uniref:hypothetical protein n=1 Tax=Aggregatibacter actinomycetemcomitans TaxID=714 RepID=UPI0011DDC6C2|nr:hypothetical protein [Aggregatibacter actinomycetemcomitans]QEH49269.1 hypothetical protein FXN57_06165 [Aggregatibacter actinomycetemcomitans]
MGQVDIWLKFVLERSTAPYNSTNLFFSKGIDDLIKLNELFSQNYHILLFISHRIIRGSYAVNSKDHWVTLAHKIKVNGKEITQDSPMDGIVTSHFFTWGNIEKFSNQVTLREFLNHFYGGLAFSPIK